MNAVMSAHPTPIQYKCSRAGLSRHTTAADDWPDPTHTHKGLHTLTSHIHTLIIPHSQRRWSSEQRWEMLPAGNHWVSSLLCALLSFSPSLSAVIAILRPARVHLSLTLSSVAVKWPVFPHTERLFKLFSQYAAHIPYSPLPAFLSFLCMWAETEANPGPICMLAQCQAWMPLCLNNRAERVDVNPLYSHFVLVWFFFPRCLCGLLLSPGRFVMFTSRFEFFFCALSQMCTVN